VGFILVYLYEDKRITMAEDKETEKKATLSESLIAINSSAFTKRKARKAANTKARSKKAKERRKQASGLSNIVGLQGLRGFYGSKK